MYNINEANELLDAIEILVEKSAKNNAVIYSGIVTEISTSVCTMKINGNTYSNIVYYGGTPIVGNAYRVFVPFGNMSQAFTLIFADTSPGESGVQSVNGKTGDVVLTAVDVGALPSGTKIPNKMSDLINDSGYITESAVPTKTSELINDSGYVDITAAKNAAPVQSVNSKTGAVTLSAADVSAIPSTLMGTAGQVLTKTADGQEWKDVDIPTALPSPNALTFTGAVTGSYDGSAPLSVEIPSGGSGSSAIELVYQHICDGTYVSVTDDLPLENGKVYLTRLTLPIGSAKLTARCLIGSQGNTYTGAVAAIVVDQHAVITKQVHSLMMKTATEIVGISYFGANLPETAGYNLGQPRSDRIGDKIYFYSTTSDINLPDGTTVEVYRMN